jgi:colicin import membrane protein
MAGRESEKESSVMFSLKELMELENHRVEEENQAELEERQAQHRARMEAELRMQAANEARRKAQDDRRRAEEASAREEAARHEAMRVAAVERARMEALDGARLGAMALDHQHQRDIAALRADKEKRTLRRLTIGGAIVSIGLLAGGLGYYLGVVQPNAQRAEQQARAEVDRANAELEKQRADKAAKDKYIEELEQQRKEAVDENERLRLDQLLRKERGFEPPKPPTGPIPTIKPPPPPPGPELDDNDPLNPNLKFKNKSG